VPVNTSWRRALAGALAVWSAAMPVLSPAAAMRDHADRDHGCVHAQHHRSSGHKSDGTPARHQPCDCCCTCCSSEGLNLTIGQPAALPASPTIEFAATPPTPSDRPSDAATQIVLPPPLGPPVAHL
jgi:hypothetical protein